MPEQTHSKTGSTSVRGKCKQVFAGVPHRAFGGAGEHFAIGAWWNSGSRADTAPTDCGNSVMLAS